jgi:hypothetical protein
MSKIKMLFMLLAVAMLTMTSCDYDDIPFPPEHKPQLLMTHASPDAPAVDLYVDDLIVAEDFTFPNSTRYTSIEQGEHKITLRKAGEKTIVFETMQTINDDGYHSFFACDEMADLSALLLADDFGSPDIDETMVRFIHLSPNAPPVDLTKADGTVIFSSLSFRDASTFKPLPSGIKDYQIRLAGMDNVMLEIDDIKLAPHAAITIWVKGFVGGENEQALGTEILFNKFVF